MDEKILELLDLTRKLLDQSMRIFNDSLIDKSVPAEEVRYSIFLRAQMNEALKFCYGAYYSCYHGWAHGGIGAARSIYEIFLDIKYINQDEIRKEERFTRFLDHGHEYLYLKMKRELQMGATISQKKQTELKNAYDQVKKKYNDKHKQDIELDIPTAEATPRYRKYNWAGLDLSEKVKVVNLTQFHQLYKELAELSHVNMDATLDAITRFTKDQIEVDLSLHPGSVHCFGVLQVMFCCIFGILEEYMKYFRIQRSRYPNLEKLWADYKKFLDS